VNNESVEVDVARGWQTQGRSTRDRRRKKQHRVQRPLSEATKPAAQEQRPQPARPTTSGSSGWRSAPARSTAVATIRAEDYQYVFSDLKRIAVLGGSIFIVLIALSSVIK
jgi:hypothetical protein